MEERGRVVNAKSKRKEKGEEGIAAKDKDSVWIELIVVETENTVVK